ncbi:MAG: alpha/beta fold hydrolase [Pseudomonadota bacterium]
MKTRSRLFLLAIAAIAVTLYLLTPARLAVVPATPSLPADLDAWLATTEAASPYPLVPGTEKRIRWQSAPGETTPIAIVYLHGFSASRREITPTMEIVADAIGANLFETRLSGHGRASGALEGTAAEEWLDDAAEALAIGERLGNRTILVGTSTGSTLAMAMVGHELMRNVSDIVLISPNFALNDERAALLTKPAGPLLADLMIGKMRSFEVHNEDHGLYWSSTYPTRAVVEAMRLVDFVEGSLPVSIPSRLLVVYSPDDQVISPTAVRAAVERIDTPDLSVVEVTETDDRFRHVIAGDILSPSTTQSVADSVIDFLRNAAATRNAVEPTPNES